LVAVHGNERTAAQQTCDTNTKTQLGKETSGKIAQINYKSASCCKAESETTRKIWSQDECSKIGEYWYKHSCQSETLLNITQHKEYICGARDGTGKCVENYYGRDCGQETLMVPSQHVEHTTGDCFEENAFSYSYDCTNYKTEKKKSTTPSAGPKKKLKTGQGESRHVLSWSAIAVSIAFCLMHASMF